LCKIIDAESGWVSDNYLAYCRLIKWMYHPITTSQTDEADKHCSKDNINMMIGGMLSMVSQIMKRDVTDETPLQMDREIKLFLSSVNIVSISLQTKYIFWIRKYNFQSLLNLPYAATLFGPLANFWEGSNCGEGYLRHVKPRIRDVHTKNWNMNVHMNLLNDNSMGSVLDTHFSNKSSKKHCAKYQRFKKQSSRLKNMYHKYNSVEELFASFKQQLPISFVRTTDGKYYAIVKKRDMESVGGISVRLQFAKKIESLSMSFHYVDFDFSIPDNGMRIIDELLIEKYLLMLPEVITKHSIIKSGDSSIYYCIDSNWQELDENIKLIYPRSPFCKY